MRPSLCQNINKTGVINTNEKSARFTMPAQRKTSGFSVHDDNDVNFVSNGADN